jgi:hypothetical protein
MLKAILVFCGFGFALLVCAVPEVYPGVSFLGTFGIGRVVDRLGSSGCGFGFRISPRHFFRGVAFQ